MDLWIRSQDREVLGKFNDIAIKTESKDGKTIRGYQIVGYFDKNTEYENLGFYTHKKIALEVLDEIQNILKPNLEIINNKISERNLLDNSREIIIQPFIENIKLQQFKTYVYEMPKE